MSSKVPLKKYQKWLAVSVVICLLFVSSIFFGIPKTTEAVCTNMPVVTTPNMMTVPVSQTMSPEYVIGQQQKSTEYFKTCVMDGIATGIAKQVIKSLTGSIVNWINSGFNGNPSFVQNPGQFFGAIGDRVAGNTIQNLAPFLCSPFKLNVQLALVMNQTSSQAEEIGCTLTDVENNLKNFTGETSGGTWSNWFNVTQNPQNNPTGAMMLAQNQLSLNVETAQGKYQQQLDWGRGFLGSESCPADSNTNSSNGPAKTSSGGVVYDSSNQPVYGVQVDNRGCYLKTPGATIQDQLDSSLNSDLRGLELAQSFDQILSAVMGQLMTKALSAGGGLVSSNSNSSSGSGGGYTYQSTTNTATTIPTIPISGWCYPTVQNANIGDTVTWYANIPSINGAVSYIWYGDENLSGNNSTAYLRYSTNGTKSGGVIVRSINNPQNVAQIDCYPSLTVGAGNSTSIPTISCTPSVSSVPAGTSMTWQATATGGNPPFTYSWQGDEYLTGTTTSQTKIYGTTGAKTAKVSVTGSDSITYTQNCSASVMVTPP